MSEATAFDTHRFVKSLTAGGFTEAQAEALAHEQAHLLSSNLTTKADVESVNADLKVAIRQVDANMKVETEQVRSDLKVRLEQVNANLKLEIEQVRSDLEVKIEQVNASLKLEIEQIQRDLEVKIEGVKSEVQKAKADLLMWMVVALTTHATLIAGLIRFS